MPDVEVDSPPFARVLLSLLSSERLVVVPMPSDERGRPREAIVLFDEDAVPRAFINRCKHVPIPLDGGSRQFLTSDKTALLCGTHGARYRLSDGYCFSGPCHGARLDALHLTIVGGVIELRERAAPRTL